MIIKFLLLISNKFLCVVTILKLLLIRNNQINNIVVITLVYISFDNLKESYIKELITYKYMGKYSLKQKKYDIIRKECVFCRRNKNIHLHHIIPRSEGGTDDIKNIIGLCPNHHSVIHTISDRSNEKIRLVNRINEILKENKYVLIFKGLEDNVNKQNEFNNKYNPLNFITKDKIKIGDLYKKMGKPYSYKTLQRKINKLYHNNKINILKTNGGVGGNTTYISLK